MIKSWVAGNEHRDTVGQGIEGLISASGYDADGERW